MALEIYKQVQGTFPELRLVIVPRHAERFDAVAEEIRDHGLFAHRRSCDESLDATQCVGKQNCKDE